MLIPASILRAARAAAQSHDVDLALLLAICWQESGFDPHAVGDLNAGISLGPWQLNLNGAGAAWRNNPSALLDIGINADAAASYLRACLDAFPDDEARSIAAFNAGVGRTSRPDWWNVNGEKYVKPVQAVLYKLRAEGFQEAPDIDLPDQWRQYGNTYEDCLVAVKGVADLALEKLRSAVARAEAIVGESKGL